MPPADCPNCGATLAKDVDACPECGADEETGWNEDAYWQDLGVTDDEFDYDEFVEREFGEKEREIKPPLLHWFWWLVGWALLAALILLWML